MPQLNNFHPIYLIFLVVLIISCFFKQSKQKAIFLTILFIITFVCAETGADYNGYKFIYDHSLKTDVHGEILYVSICKIFKALGVSYNLFRVIFLSTFTTIASYAIYKLSKNFSFSFLLAYMLYVVYFVSAYRQFATMAIFLITIYLYLYRNKKLLSILLNFIAIFIHSVAVVQFALMLIIYFYEKVTKKQKVIEKSLLKKYFYLLIAGCFVIRFALYIVLQKTPVGAMLMQSMTYSELSFINFGLISRLVILFFISNMYIHSEKSTEINVIFSMYFISMILYLMFPFELIMGRLMNNLKLLEIILIPNLTIKKETKNINVFKKKINIDKLQIALILCVVSLVFVSQMFNQGGYETYNHMIMEVFK